MHHSCIVFYIIGFIITENTKFSNRGTFYIFWTGKRLYFYTINIALKTQKDISQKGLSHETKHIQDIVYIKTTNYYILYIFYFVQQPLSRILQYTFIPYVCYRFIKYLICIKVME